MAHQRKLIRQAVVSALANAATAAGERVQGTRVDPHKRSELPAIAVYTLSEAVEQADTSPRELTRDVRLEVAGFVAHTEAVPADDAMDDLAEQIEAALDGQRFLGGLVAESVLTGTEMAVRADDGKSAQLIGVVTLTYSVTYRTSPDTPAPPDDFLLVGATHQIAGAAESIAPTDVINVKETP